MNILVTGAKGMVGTALVNNLYNIKDNKNRTRPNIHIDEIDCYDMDSTAEELEQYCQRADFVFHLAGVNRPKNNEEFMNGNFGFASTLLDTLKKYQNNCPVMLASSIQATLIGRYGTSDYGRSKLAGEELFFQYGKETGGKIAVYRFPNLMGHSRPNYNSAVSTFCHAIANDLPYTVNDRNTELELLYIDDLVEGMFDLLEGKEIHCEYDGLEPVPIENGRYCYIPVTHKETLGHIIDLLESFKQQPQTLMMPSIPEGSFAKKLYSLYLTYLPKEKIAFDLKMNCDARGSFTELLKTTDRGQFSVNITKPGVTKGQHWHNSKWEFFIVVSGHGLIQEREIGTDDIIEFEVSGEKIQAVHMIPGWTHNIINLSETEDLVTIMWANEIFDPNHPDTFYEEV
ncbi:putative epimerase/dehydratase [Clostridiales bacterium CHKCI006]|nr:putative epimerase/dehydratase [Clostridiales bacterium CHKCI006]